MGDIFATWIESSSLIVELGYQCRVFQAGRRWAQSAGRECRALPLRVVTKAACTSGNARAVPNPSRQPSPGRRGLGPGSNILRAHYYAAVVIHPWSAPRETALGFETPL